SARAYDAATGQLRVAYRADSGASRFFAIAPDGATLATAGTEQTVRLWDLAAGRLRQAVKGRPAPYYAVAFAADGQTLAAGEGGQVMLWDWQYDRTVAALHGRTEQGKSLAFSPDGHWLLTGSYDGTAKLWDVAAARAVATINPGQPAGRVFAAAFAPDGKAVV